MATRVALYLIKTYQVMITQQTETLRPLLQSIAIHLKYHFKNQRVSLTHFPLNRGYFFDQDTIGINLAALSILQKSIAEINDRDFAGMFSAPSLAASDPFHE